MASQRAKRPIKEEPPEKRSKRRHLSCSDDDDSRGPWSLKSSTCDLPTGAFYNSTSRTQPAELFRKDLISAMKLPDSEPLAPEDYFLITDSWKIEWEKGVQVPVNPESIPDAVVRPMKKKDRRDFKLPKKYLRTTHDEYFSNDLHQMSNALTQAETMCRYDLDNCDAHWLKAVNAESSEVGFPPIDEKTFEIVMEDLETQCYDNMQHSIKTEAGLGIEYDEDVICDVCRSPDSEEGNEMVFCDSCNICVHQACYGIMNIPEGSWLCRTCAVAIKPTCLLCPNKGGAMKSTRSGTKWAHVSCALWIPEVSIGCVDKMEPITKINQIPPSRWALVCCLCKERVGACIQCSVKTCKTAYHVTCAFQENLDMKAIVEDENDEDGVKLRSYCPKHSKNRESDASSDSENEDVRHKTKNKRVSSVKSELSSKESANIRAQRIQEIEAEFSNYVNVQEVADSTSVCLEVVDLIYSYWKLKRTAAFNKPLITPKSEETNVLSRQEEDSLYARMKMFIHLRQDLERVRNLCYMVNRREKLHRSWIRMREQLFHKQLAVLEDKTVTLTESERHKVVHAAHGNSLYDQLYSWDISCCVKQKNRPSSSGMGSPVVKGPNGIVKGNNQLKTPEKQPNPYAKTYFNGRSQRRSGSNALPNGEFKSSSPSNCNPGSEEKCDQISRVEGGVEVNQVNSDVNDVNSDVNQVSSDVERLSVRTKSHNHHRHHNLTFENRLKVKVVEGGVKKCENVVSGGVYSKHSSVAFKGGGGISENKGVLPSVVEENFETTSSSKSKRRDVQEVSTEITSESLRKSQSSNKAVKRLSPPHCVSPSDGKNRKISVEDLAVEVVDSCRKIIFAKSKNVPTESAGASRKSVAAKVKENATDSCVTVVHHKESKREKTTTKYHQSLEEEDKCVLSRKCIYRDNGSKHRIHSKSVDSDDSGEDETTIGAKKSGTSDTTIGSKKIGTSDTTIGSKRTDTSETIIGIKKLEKMLCSPPKLRKKSPPFVQEEVLKSNEQSYVETCAPTGLKSSSPPCEVSPVLRESRHRETTTTTTTTVKREKLPRGCNKSLSRDENKDGKVSSVISSVANSASKSVLSCPKRVGGSCSNESLVSTVSDDREQLRKLDNVSTKQEQSREVEKLQRKRENRDVVVVTSSSESRQSKRGLEEMNSEHRRTRNLREKKDKHDSNFPSREQSRNPSPHEETCNLNNMNTSDESCLLQSPKENIDENVKVKENVFPNDNNNLSSTKTVPLSGYRIPKKSLASSCCESEKIDAAVEISDFAVNKMTDNSSVLNGEVLPRKPSSIKLKPLNDPETSSRSPRTINNNNNPPEIKVKEVKETPVLRIVNEEEEVVRSPRLILKFRKDPELKRWRSDISTSPPIRLKIPTKPVYEPPPPPTPPPQQHNNTEVSKYSMRSRSGGTSSDSNKSKHGSSEPS